MGKRVSRSIGIMIDLTDLVSCVIQCLVVIYYYLQAVINEGWPGGSIKEATITAFGIRRIGAGE